MSKELVLVTGGTGLIALHCIKECFSQGFTVRTTIRSESKKDAIMDSLKRAGIPSEHLDQLQFTVADLLQDDGWNAAVEGCTYILHVASPFPENMNPSDENELIAPARDGTLRVLKAAKAAGTVKRVVVTSSIAAVCYGITPSNQNGLFTEEDFTDENSPSFNNAYVKSKTIAEKAAWEYIRGEGVGLEMATVNPAAVFGPPLRPDGNSTTIGMVEKLLDGSLPAVPRLRLSLVDVRDVATLHLLAMTKPEAANQRYIAVASSTSFSFMDMCNVLRTKLGDRAQNLPTREIPDWLTRILSYVVPMMKSLKGEIGQDRRFSNQKALDLGWNPKSPEESLTSAAEAVLAFKEEKK
ncbi:dihydrokaempferol 4-reductase [Planoprotostelium fungivorum]|uniref:Dihydrokaempferol 4-reductase n=1 Tax=Planoprotostelium fungivorum TaxID=1890364 RepID=A0A2P6NTP3_9EUKA|nr:dihydrokaempferol 4-reductase [Planoprotostelium fungivorum]